MGCPRCHDHHDHHDHSVMMEEDKVLHLVAGTVIYGVTDYFFGPEVAAASVLVAAIGKEVFDGVSGTGTADVNDIVATLAGSGVMLAIKWTF